MKNSKKIKALGFVEVIIAIVVVGISSAVFLTMSGRAMKELVQVERIEYMKRIAKDGVNIAQEIADKEKNALPGEDFFPNDSGDDNACYIPIRDDSGYRFLQDMTNFTSISLATNSEELRDWAINYGTGNISSGTVNPETNPNEDYFLVMCIKPGGIDTTGTKWANVYFWVGDIHVAGNISSETDMKDFKYHAIIDL